GRPAALRVGGRVRRTQHSHGAAVGAGSQGRAGVRERASKPGQEHGADGLHAPRRRWVWWRARL
ncbi:MAG: hypothetical protein AVDCRST_MAG80-655, partial [uncultured Rubrobacteraceae bacterium]